MYRASCAVYYPDQQITDYNNSILYIVNTPTCFDLSASSSGRLILQRVLAIVIYFDVCTVHFVQFIIQTNKSQIIITIFYIS